MKFLTDRHLRQLLILTALVFASCLSLIPAADAYAHEDSEYRVINKKLRGSYGFLAQAYFGATYDEHNNDTHSALAMRAGVMKFDGKGKCSIQSMANKAGLPKAVRQDTDKCTYEVYENGTGELTAFLGGPNNTNTFNAFFVLVNDGKEFMFTRLEGTDNDDAVGATLAFGLAKKQ